MVSKDITEGREGMGIRARLRRVIGFVHTSLAGIQSHSPHLSARKLGNVVFYVPRKRG